MVNINYRINEAAYQSAIRDLQMDVTRKAVLAMNAVGAETVAFLRSQTSEMRPPAHVNGPMRPAHPGHWADISGALALAYAYEVVVSDNGVQLRMLNSMEYAVYLENHLGYWVLSGVTDPGGPVDQALNIVSEVVGFEVTQ